MVPLTHPETQTRSITLQMNSKWKIKEAGTQSHHRIQLKKKKKHESRNNREKAGLSVAKLYPPPYNSSNGVRSAGVVCGSLNHGLGVNQGGFVNLRWDESTSTQRCFSVFCLASPKQCLRTKWIECRCIYLLPVVITGQQSTSPTARPGWAPGNY